MHKVEYSPVALEDLQLIRDYIASNWGESVAKKVLKKMTSDIRRLEQYHLSGVDLGKIIHVPTEYRYIFSEKNYIFYHIGLEKVRIIRVLNEHQDYMNQLFDIRGDSDDPTPPNPSSHP